MTMEYLRAREVDIRLQCRRRDEETMGPEEICVLRLLARWSEELSTPLPWDMPRPALEPEVELSPSDGMDSDTELELCLGPRRRLKQSSWNSGGVRLHPTMHLENHRTGHLRVS